jgi:hypothetical protein
VLRRRNKVFHNDLGHLIRLEEPEKSNAGCSRSLLYVPAYQHVPAYQPARSSMSLVRFGLSAMALSSIGLAAVIAACIHETPHSGDHRWSTMIIREPGTPRPAAWADRWAPKRLRVSASMP